MMPGMDPKQLERVMKTMGIKSKNIDAKKVVIEQEGSKLIIENPQVVEIDMQGKKSYQITGEPKQEESISEDDLKMVMEQAEVSEEEAKKALKECNGDIAEAIIKLKG